MEDKLTHASVELEKIKFCLFLIMNSVIDLTPTNVLMFIKLLVDRSVV